MDNQIHDNKRILKNSVFLYIRMFITLCIALYTSRVVLRVLGFADYGTYNVVGGIVTMFTFLNGTLASGSQRFLSTEIGHNDLPKLKQTFSSTLLLHILLSLVILLLAETIGLYFLNTELNIPAGRETAAFWTYQFSIIATIVGIIQVPFMASIIAHERMNIYAYVSIFDVSMKLLIVFLIQILDYDKLILYGFLILMVNLSTALIYNLYCRKSFEECRFRIRYNKTIFQSILSFSGWNVFGCLGVTFNTSGVDIILNLFFGTIMNAARGIVFQVNGLITQFVNNVLFAVNPQIIKLYAANQIKELFKLVTNTSKFGAIFFLVLMVPLFIEIRFVLDIWLGDYPEYTVPFIRIILIQSLIQTIGTPLVTLNHAVGRMKMPCLTSGLTLMLILPVTYLLFKLGFGPITVLIINIIPWILEQAWLMYWMHKYIHFPIQYFLRNVYYIIIPSSLVCFAVPFTVQQVVDINIYIQFIAVGISSVVTSIGLLYAVILTKDQKCWLKQYLKKRFLHK